MTDFKQNDNEHPDHIELHRLLHVAKPIAMPMFPDQRKKWVAESSHATCDGDFGDSCRA